MAQIEAQLPPGIALIGSDYRALHLEDRVDQGSGRCRIHRGLAELPHVSAQARSFAR